MLLRGEKKIYDWSQDLFWSVGEWCSTKKWFMGSPSWGGKRLSETYVLDFPQGKLNTPQTEFWQRMNGASLMMTHTKFWQTDESDLGQGLLYNNISLNPKRCILSSAFALLIVLLIVLVRHRYRQHRYRQRCYRQQSLSSVLVLLLVLVVVRVTQVLAIHLLVLTTTTFIIM